jgi:hypothetical protein
MLISADVMGMNVLLVILIVILELPFIIANSGADTAAFTLLLINMSTSESTGTAATISNSAKYSSDGTRKFKHRTITKITK